MERCQREVGAQLRGRLVFGSGQPDGDAQPLGRALWVTADLVEESGRRQRVDLELSELGESFEFRAPEGGGFRPLSELVQRFAGLL